MATPKGRGYSRRTFLTGLGVGLGAAGAPPAATPGSPGRRQPPEHHGVPTDPAATLNAHTAAFDLDTVYGLGPFVNAQYYDVNDNAKLRIESGGLFEDLPRNADMTAIIPDPRTDQHMMLSGLHCAFILFHNKVVDYVRQQGLL